MAESHEVRAGRITSLDHDGLVFDVYDEGPIDGDVVVLLHGFPERSSTWSLVAPLLHAQGFRTVAMDQRGYSPRARPPRRRDYKLRLLVGDVAALIDAVGTPVHVVGHDWGAVVAWDLALRHPTLVRTLTAVSVPHPTPFLSALVRSRQGLKSWYIGFFQLPGAPERAAAKPGGLMDGFLRRAGMTRDEVARFRREIVDHGALPYALNWYRALPFVDRDNLGDRVVVPTTFVWSDGDVAIGRWGVDRTADYVDAPYELVVLTGVTHWIPTQAPAALAEAVLERVASST